MNVGTEFMAKLHEQLKYFVAKKVSSDRLWQGLRIYLSGHEVIWVSSLDTTVFVKVSKSVECLHANKALCVINYSFYLSFEFDFVIS